MTSGARAGRSKVSGPLAILVAALLWSSAGLLFKYIPWHPLAIASGRSFLAALVILAYYGRKLWVRPNRMTVISGLSLVVTMTLFVAANKLTTATNAIMLQYTSPIFIILLGAVFFKVRPQREELLAMFWALAGIVLFFFDNISPGNLLGNLLAICTGLTFAAVFVLNNQSACQGPTALFIGQAGTFLVGLPFLLQVRPADLTAKALIAIGLLGIFQLGISYVIFQYGLRLTRPLNASLISMAEPIMNPVWVFLILGEKPGWLALAGALLVVSAAVFLNTGRLRHGRLPDPGDIESVSSP